MATEVNIAFYNSALAWSVAQAAACNKWHTDNEHTLTLKDVYGLSEANVDTYVGTLDAATYDKAYFFTTTGGASGSVTTQNKYTLRAKMKVASQGTDGATIENITTHTTTSIGDSGESWTTNEHAGLYVYLNGGTGSGQIAHILSNDTTILTLGETLTTDPDTTTDIAIVTGLEYYHPKAETATTGADMKICWDYFYSTNVRPQPYIFHVFSDKYANNTSTATGISSTTLTNSGAPWTADAMIGKYVQIYTATTNGHQYGYISDNSTTVLTVTGWLNDTSKGAPTGTPIYTIVDTLSEVFLDLYLALYITTYLYDLSDSVIITTWKKLLDMTDGDATRPYGASLLQDQDFIFDVMKPTGKIIFDSTYTTA